jgi:hypothetical protein
MIKVTLPQSIPSWGTQSLTKEVMGTDVLFGPAEATLQLSGQDQQISYVPAGWIGYVQFQRHGGLYCRMISSEATASGRELAQRLWELKGQADMFWYHLKYPSTFRSAG